MHFGFCKLADGGKLRPKPKPQLRSTLLFQVSSLSLSSNNAVGKEIKNLNRYKVLRTVYLKIRFLLSVLFHLCPFSDGVQLH